MTRKVLKGRKTTTSKGDGTQYCHWLSIPFEYGKLPQRSKVYRQAWANSVDSCMSSLIFVYTVCHSVCILWMHYSIIEPHCSNVLIITAFFGVSKYLGVLWYVLKCQLWHSQVTIVVPAGPHLMSRFYRVKLGLNIPVSG